VFTLERMRGSLFLVCETKEAPYTVLEGYSRLTVNIVKYMANELLDTHVGVIIGVCPQIDDWYLDDNPQSVKLVRHYLEWHTGWSVK